MRRPSPAALVGLAALALIGVGFSIHAYQWRERVVDDAFITWRFAENLAAGRGLVWNVGGEPTEGYTTSLHVFLLALLHRAGVPTPAASVALSLLATLATAALLLRVAARHLGGAHPWVVVVIGIYFVDGHTAAHAFSGMETPLFVATVVAMTAAALRFVDAPSRANGGILAAAMALATLCRPDAIPFVAGTFAALLAGAVLARPLGLRPIPRIPLSIAVGLFAAFAAAYAAWKLWTFGYLLPNPFYLKSDPGQALAFAGWRDVVGFERHVRGQFAPLLPVALAAALLGVPLHRYPRWAREALADPRARLKVLVVLVPAALALAYCATIFHEVGFRHRFSYPIYPLIAVTLAAAVAVLVRRWDPRGRRVVVVALVAILAAVLVHRKGDYQLRNRGPEPYEAYHARLADALARTALGSDGVVTTVAAGLIPYRTKFTHVDPVGLTDNALSGRRAMTHEERETLLWSRRSDVYLGYEPPATPGAERPEDDPLMRTEWVAMLLRPGTYLLDLRRPRFGRVTDERLERLVHARMRRLRDEWVWLGEMENQFAWEGLELRTLIHVRRDSPHFEVLMRELRPIIDVPAEAVDLERRHPRRERMKLRTLAGGPPLRP